MFVYKDEMGCRKYNNSRLPLQTLSYHADNFSNSRDQSAYPVAVAAATMD